MKIASILWDGQPAVAICFDHSNWRRVSNEDHRYGCKKLARMAELGSLTRDELTFASQPMDEQSWRFLCPIDECEKVICVGKNYRDHAREMGGPEPQTPVIFNKFPSTLIGHQEPIVLPTLSKQVDYEAELVVVIGKDGRNIPRSQALEHVFGYTIGNDITARDWQRGCPAGQWLLGKSFDSFAPLGPYLVTADEVHNPFDLQIALTLNGQVMQSASTSQMIFPIDVLIEHVSRFATLKFGDLLFTGTPAGVGAGRNPPRFLAPGDQLQVTISGLGMLSNPVIAAGTC